MWRCSTCGNITKGSIFVTDGYCKKCKKYYVLERYDPINEDKPKEEMIDEKCSICGLPLGETYDHSLNGKFSHLPEIFVNKEDRESYPDWFFHGCDGCKHEKKDDGKCKDCFDYRNFEPSMEEEAWKLEMHKRIYHGKIFKVT